MTVDCDREVPVEVDGELWGRAESLDFRHSERKLKVLAPRETKNRWVQILENLTPWSQKK